MSSVRIGRVNEEIRNALSELIRTVKDPRVDGLVSVVRVETASDLGSAKVFISVLGDEAKTRACVRGLTSAAGYLRREVARKISLRHTPNLSFIADNSIVAGTHIMELIDNVAKNDTKKRVLDVSEALDFLKTRENVLVLTHKSPDGDTIGSASALTRFMRAMGKEAYILENPELTGKLRRRVRSLFAPEDFVPGCVIAVDCADEKLLFPEASEFAENVDLVIDHHITHRSFARRELVDATAAACGEIIFDIIKASSIRLSKKISEDLYVAIATDTGRFLHANTTEQTHKKAAELLSNGIDFESINREYFVEKTRARIALEAKLLSNITLSFGGKVAVIKLTNKMISEAKAKPEDLEGLSALSRVIKGTALGIYIHEKDGAAKVSLRSDESVNSASFCEYFGGGGHERAAGCTIKTSVDEAERLILSRLGELDLF